MTKFKGITLAVSVIATVITAFYLGAQQEPIDKATKELYFQRIAEWSRGINAIFMEDPLSSNIGQERLRRMNELDRKLLVPLGPKVLPYLIVVYQYNQWIGLAILRISKFEAHNIVLSHKPRNLLSTTEEFPEVIEKDIVYNSGKIVLYWWLEGEKRTPKWFAQRYSEWLALRRQGKTDEAKEAKEWVDWLQEPWKKRRHNLTAYQKLLDIGIAAIPLWLEKLRAEKDAGVRQAIMEALGALTDGEVKSSMSVQECLNWWQANKERWKIPFPKSKKFFLEWLEKEAWEEPRLSLGPVLTISCLEDEAAIDALLRLLKHPSPLMRSVSLEQMQKLFGEQLPKEYRLGVGTDEWESVGDLMEAGKYDLVRERMRKIREKMKEKGQAEKVAKELSDWWQSKRGKVVIYWQRAWKNL